MGKSVHLSVMAKPWFGLTALLLLMVLCVDNVHAQTTILDNIGRTYENAASSWSGTLFGIAKGLFLKLALLEILWFGIMFLLEKDDPRQFLVMLMKKIMALLFFYAILLNFDVWIPAIIDGFSQAGSTAGQTGTLTPSGVMERGLSLSTAILDKAQELDWTDIGPFLLAVLVSVMILLAFVVIAGQMLVTLIESYIVVSAGVLFLGFAGSRWTTTFAEKFISFAVSTGVKLFVTYLIIGAGQSLSDTWLGSIQSAQDPSGYFEVLAGAIVYTFLAFQIPSLASSMLTGSVSMTLGGAAATAGTVAGAGVGAAGVAATMAAGTAGGSALISKTVGASIGTSKAAGAQGLAGVAGGAAVALGGATAGAVADGIKGLGGQGATSGLAGRLNNTTAALNEAKAASQVSAPNVPGGISGGSSSTNSGGGFGGPVSPPSSSAGSAPNVSGSSGSPGQGAIEAQGQSSKPEVGSTENSSTPSQAQPTTEQAGQKIASPERATPSAPKVSAPNQPAAPSASKPSLTQQLTENAKNMGELPNDAAPSAGVQINFKTD